MPAPKKPVEVKQKVLARTGEMDDTQLPYIFLDQLVANYHPELSETNFTIGYCYGWKANRDGRIILASVSLFNDYDRQLHGKDVKILLNYNYWHNPTTNDDNRHALMDHQLSHPRPIMDKDLAVPVRNDMGAIKYYLRQHDIEDFADVVNRWGIWQIEMQRSAEALAEAWEKEKKAREEKSLEELEDEAADSGDEEETEEIQEMVTLSR